MQANSLPIRGGNQDLLYRPLGPAHASRNHHYTYVCQQKRVNPMESVESSYKRLNSCFMAIASFHKVYYTSKGLAFFLTQVSRAFRKMGVVLN